MTPDIILTLGLLTILVVFFAMEWLPVDLTALLGLVALVLCGLLSVDKALSGFANEITITLACVFIIAGTLAKSGLSQHAANAILKMARRKTFLTPVLMSVAAVLSAFFSNTSATGMLIPATLRVARKTRQPSSQLLMPLAFASILGGACTLIGTSTNLAGASLMTRLGLEPFSLFEFTLVGLLVAVVGILYMSLFGHRLIPRRDLDDMFQVYHVRDYLSELLIDANSDATGETLSSLKLESNEITPLSIIRERRRLSAHGNRRLQAGDKIVVKASREALLHSRDNPKFSIEAESTLTDNELLSDDMGISEVVLIPQSRLVGSSLKQLDFYSSYQVAVLAIYRRGQAYPIQIENSPLRVGDVLLLQGSKQKLRNLLNDPNLLMVREIEGAPISTRKGIYALLALFGAVLATSMSWLPVSMAFLLASVALVVTRCTTMEEAYSSIEWRLIVLIASMSAFGVAMQDTGTASYLADLIATSISPMGVHVTLAAFAVLAVALTQPMSNAAAALVLIPVAVSTAQMMGVDPRPFAVVVTLSASLSFITPLEPASLLVFGVGKYRFLDFSKVGLPLTLISIAILVGVVPLFWPA